MTTGKPGGGGMTARRTAARSSTHTMASDSWPSFACATPRPYAASASPGDKRRTSLQSSAAAAQARRRMSAVARCANSDARTAPLGSGVASNAAPSRAAVASSASGPGRANVQRRPLPSSSSPAPASARTSRPGAGFACSDNSPPQPGQQAAAGAGCAISAWLAAAAARGNVCYLLFGGFVLFCFVLLSRSGESSRSGAAPAGGARRKEPVAISFAHR